MKHTPINASECASRIPRPPIVFNDWPRPITVDAYDSTKLKVLQLLKVYPAVDSLYEIGTINVPGVSDLDLLVVLKNRQHFPYRGFIRRLWREVNTYVMVHEPIVINQALMDHLEDLYPIVRLEPIHGGGTGFRRTLNEARIQSLAICYLNEYLLIKLPREILRQATSSKPVSARHTLLLLNSLKHSVWFYGLAGGAPRKDWSDYFNQLTLFRSTIPSGSKEDAAQLSHLVDEALRIAFELLDLTARLPCIRQIGLENRLHQQETWKFTGHLPALFCREWRPGPALEITRKQFLHGASELVLPYELIWYWISVACTDTKYGSFVGRQLILDSSEVRLNPMDCIRDHVARIDQYIQFCRDQMNYWGAYYLTLGAGEGPVIRFFRRYLSLIRDR